jgi:CBS domain containing-hemolysin-like protein
MVMVSMIAVNSLLAGYEIALASISVSRLHVLVRDKRAGATTAFRMKEKLPFTISRETGAAETSTSC